MTVDTDLLTPGAVVIIAAFDDIPEHRFLIEEVFEDLVTGVALSGPFEGEYGEPDREMILEIVSPDHRKGSQGTS